MDVYFRLFFSNAFAAARNPKRNRVNAANGTVNPNELDTPMVVALSDATE